MIAETEAAARAGAEAIVAVWEDLPVMSDIDSALTRPAPPSRERAR